MRPQRSVDGSWPGDPKGRPGPRPQRSVDGSQPGDPKGRPGTQLGDPKGRSEKKEGGGP